MANWELPVTVITVSCLGILAYLGNTWKMSLLDSKKQDGTQISIGSDKTTLMKVLLVLFALWLILIPLQLSVEIAEANTAPQDVLTLLEAFYVADMYANITVSTFTGIFLLVNMLVFLGVDVASAFRGGGKKR